MLKVEMLYRPFHMKKIYRDIPEEKILTSLYDYKQGRLEVVISRIINEAVLKHMDLYIDSTIMQMLSLNDYLSELFMTNFERLIYNYSIYYIEAHEIEEINEEIEEELESLCRQVEMKTELRDLLTKLDALCEAY